MFSFEYNNPKAILICPMLLYSTYQQLQAFTLLTGQFKVFDFSSRSILRYVNRVKKFL